MPVMRLGPDPLERVLAHGLQQPAKTIVLGAEQRVCDQRLERLERGQLERVLERGAAAEDRERAQRPLGLGVEQAVAPVQRGTHRHQRERVVEPAGDRAGGEHRDARGGQLERQRHALEPAADLRDRALVIAAPRPADTPGAVVEERRGGRGRERRDLPARLADDPQRHPACREDREPTARLEQPRDHPRGVLGQVLAVVEHEQHTPRAEERAHRVEVAEPGQRSHVQRTHERGGDVVAARERDPVRVRAELAGRAAGAARAGRAARAGCAARAPAPLPAPLSPPAIAATAAASRVLPTPPGPVSVSSRVPASARPTAASSSSRPISVVSCAGITPPTTPRAPPYSASAPNTTATDRSSPSSGRITSSGAAGRS